MLTIICAAAAAAATPAPIEVIVLGTYHFDNPGRDIVNARIEDVTTPRHQRELAALADAVAAFRPTRVMVEAQRKGPAYDVAGYRTFTPGDLSRNRDEVIQIGYRIAARAGLKSVQGIDEQPEGDEPDYFPADKLDAYVKAHGEQAAYDALFAPIKAEAARTEADQTRLSIPQMLLRYNDDSTPTGGQSVYYGMLKFGDGEAQPGADLNAMWYLRNAKIFSKLINVAKPGDRIVVVYGAGHGYWLRHFAQTVPGYRLVDVKPYPARAAAAAAR